ncbi:MAG: isopentenyl-diphosphate Delta-isomerase [Bacteroidota bacterium]|nr:isopentenyl-diphosphate Delta-isomerase [Bacteroidota bacterium]
MEEERKEYVILVDENDNELGVQEKMAAHVEGALHRAFSVFVFNSDGDLIIQQRAFSKYHSPGKWANTCCSHPRKGEEVIEAAHRRLQEEMGFDTELKETFSFLYKADVGQGLIEHELDHVIIGRYDEKPNINLKEVASWKAVSMEDIREDIKLFPQQYAEWFKIVFEKVNSFNY